MERGGVRRVGGKSSRNSATAGGPAPAEFHSRYACANTAKFSQVGQEENDGQVLFDKLQAAGPSNFFAAIRDVEGPYAFVYYQGE